MDKLLDYLPPTDQGLLPYYLLLVGVVSIGNSIQNLATLHYTRRIYNAKFVTNKDLQRASATPAAFDDSVHKLVPASSQGKNTEPAQDQVTPLAARVFGVWTTLAGLVRIYTAYDTASPALYQLSIITHVVAAMHFTSELFIFKTMKLTGPQYFPLAAGYGGSIWMLLQYSHYVSK